MSTIDLTPVWQAAVSLGAIALGTFGSLALNRLAQRFHIQIKADQASAFDVALNKALTFGVTQTTAAIAAKGWDDPEVKSSVVASAINKLIDRFPDAIKGVGLTTDINDPHNRQVILEALARALPGAFKDAASSPATPPETAPAPPSPPIVVVKGT